MCCDACPDRTPRWTITVVNAANQVRFDRLAAEWRRATGHLSTTIAIASHPAYQRIIGMGPVALPMIFAEMERAPGPWFLALETITGTDPVSSASKGLLEEETAHWLNWGRERGYHR